MTRTEKINQAEQAVAGFAQAAPMMEMVNVARKYEDGSASLKDLAIAFNKINTAREQMQSIVKRTGEQKYQDALTVLETVAQALALATDLDESAALANEVIITPDDDNRTLDIIRGKMAR